MRPPVWRHCHLNQPADVVHEAGLQQEISSRQEIVTDEVLVGADSHSVADAERAQDVQDLGREAAVAPCPPRPAAPSLPPPPPIRKGKHASSSSPLV